MTDFYALLKQSIIERGIRKPSDRQEVYAQARRAIIRQLWAYQPPLAEDEIDTRVGAYDTAVERIEADLRKAFADGEIPIPEKAATSPDEPEAEELGDAPPFADWVDEDEDYAPIERARPAPRASARSSAREPPTRTESRHDDDDDEYESRNAVRRSRWTGDDQATDEPSGRVAGIVQRFLGLDERDKIRVLAGAIAGLAVALIGLGTYYTFGRSADDGVTLPIGVRREVSDAATAVRIAADKLDVSQSFAIFDGRDPTIFATTPDNPVRFDSNGGYARVSSSVSAPGVKVLIGPGLAARLAGQNVRITIVVRSSLESGAASMRFAYQSGLAISHWQTANLESDYGPVAMLWRLPAMRTNPNGDYLLIEPGIPGDGTGVDIQSIKIDLIASS